MMQCARSESTELDYIEVMQSLCIYSIYTASLCVDALFRRHL